MRMRWFPLLLAGFLTAAPEATSQEPPTPADDRPAADFDDPAFGRYVEPEQLRKALADLDPAALADCGLQLAEGERVLFRTHKAIDADKVLKLAARVAGEAGDKETLARLGKAAKALNKEPLTALIDASAKLAGEARSVKPVGVDAAQAGGEQVLLYQGILEEVREAKLFGNRAELEKLAQEVDGFAEMPAKMAAALKAATGEALAGLPKEPSADMQLLAQLSAASRLSDGAYPVGTVAIDTTGTPINWVPAADPRATAVLDNGSPSTTVVGAGTVAISVPPGRSVGIVNTSAQPRVVTRYRLVSVKVFGKTIKQRVPVSSVTIPGRPTGFGLTGGSRPKVTLK